jgi:protein arginine kinase activator
VKCQLCSNPATKHFTDIVAGKKREMHLCQQCAEAQNLAKPTELNLPAILQSLIGQHLGQQTDRLAKQTCPECGIRYMEFRAQGRLGCPHDYAVFREALEPLLRRIHRAERHVGKSPRRQVDQARHAEIMDLRKRLKEAVEAEAYEEAAQLRDLLRAKEATG